MAGVTTKWAVPWRLFSTKIIESLVRTILLEGVLVIDAEAALPVDEPTRVLERAEPGRPALAPHPRLQAK